MRANRRISAVLAAFVGIALWVGGVGPLAISPASAAVTPGAFTARLSCTDAKVVLGVGDVTVTDPDTRATIVDADLYVRIDSNPFVIEATKTMNAAPSTGFSYTATFPSDVDYLASLDARLVVDGGNPNEAGDVIAGWDDVVVRAGQGQGCTSVVDANFGAITRDCTTPGVLSGTVTITDAVDEPLGLVLISGVTVAADPDLDGPNADTWSWSVNFGDARLGSSIQYELTDDSGLPQPIAVGSLSVPTCLGQRIFGQDAIDTAIAISNKSFPEEESAPVVLLARSDFFSDALTGGPLAAQLGGPMLITPGGPAVNSIDPDVLDEIERVLDPDGEVVVLGGPLAISPGIVDQLVTAGFDVRRVSGDNLFSTAVEIADELGNPGTIFEATGTDFPDALSSVPAAITKDAAILLTNGPTQSTETAQYLQDHQGVTRYAIGGPLAAAGADPTAIPVFGQDLFGTSAKVADVFFPADVDGGPLVFGVATGVTFPDALAGGVFMATGGRDGPLLLVNPLLPIPTPIGDYILALTNPQVAWVFGGPLAISDAVVGGIIILAT